VEQNGAPCEPLDECVLGSSRDTPVFAMKQLPLQRECELHVGTLISLRYPPDASARFLRFLLPRQVLRGEGSHPKTLRPS
jgi:hypothetical protein